MKHRILQAALTVLLLACATGTFAPEESAESISTITVASLQLAIEVAPQGPIRATIERIAQSVGKTLGLNGILDCCRGVIKPYCCWDCCWTYSDCATHEDCALLPQSP